MVHPPPAQVHGVDPQRAGLASSASALSLASPPGQAGQHLFPRLRLLRMGAGTSPAMRPSWHSFTTIRWFFTAVFPCVPGRKSCVPAIWHGLPSSRSAHRCSSCTAAPTASPRSNPARSFFQRAGATDKTLRLYPELYHEVLNEPEREQVLADLIRVDRSARAIRRVVNPRSACRSRRCSVRRNRSCSRGPHRSGFPGPHWGCSPGRSRDRALRS